MKAIVAIPFRGNPAILSWVLDGFAQQQLPAGMTLEVRVGGDGCAPPAAPDKVAPGVTINTRALPRVGNSVAKNLLLANVDADVVIFGNADTRPEPDCVARHVDRVMNLPEGSMVLGAAPYEKAAVPTIFDAMIERTPAIFFYCQMKSGQWYDYRFCWTLNLSMRAADFKRLGGFSDKLFPYGYEDLELGYRLMGTQRKGIYYDADIRVTHRHPMTFDQYLMREEMLGLMGPVVYQIAPEMAAHLFGAPSARDLAAQFEPWVKMDAPMHQWIYRRMQEWVARPESELDASPLATSMLSSIYQMHIPLKRLAFRLGFLRGMTITDPQQRATTGLWRAVVKDAETR